MKHSTDIKGRLARIAAIGAFLAGSVCMAGAAAATGGAPAQKPAPTLQAPPPSDNKVTAPVPSKDRQSFQQLASWTITLDASSTNIWPTQNARLTATTNHDVGPTPYYISIYNLETQTYIAICASGTTCSVLVTSPIPAVRHYYAYVSRYPTTNPPSDVQARFDLPLAIFWKSSQIALQVHPGTNYLGLENTLTATTNWDIGPSPFWTAIYDHITGTRLAVCGSSNTCSVSVAQSLPATHRYIAYLADNSAAYPPSAIQATSNTVYLTWTIADYRIGLTSSAVSQEVEKVTATTNIDIGPTPYYISIYNQSTGNRVAICGAGTICSVDASLHPGHNSFVAFVAPFDTALPPANVMANSNVANVYYDPLN